MTNKVLITTAIDYTNDVIHIGHAYQKILADCVARFYRLKLGEDSVYFLTGTDEYGTTNEKAAKARDLEPKAHVDDISAKDKEQLDALNISYNRFIRTTDADHKKSAQQFYQKAFDNGDIYKGTYEGLYCEGCESYKTLSELNEAGQCVYHPTRVIQKVTEENYFFKWSKYAGFLRELVSSADFVMPEGKKKEMLGFIEQGITDIPVSRPKYKVSWGIDVPNDPDHVIYVWFDALINYYTAGSQNDFWNEDTKIIHVLGKDNARWHVLLWPAMLKSVGYKLPDTVYVHGFMNLNGQKMSKSTGNIIRPSEIVERLGVDAVRYYFLRYGPVVEDVNILENHITEIYNSELANGLGNTVARVARLAERSGFEFDLRGANDSATVGNLWSGEWAEPFEKFRVDLVLQNIWKKLADLDKHINDNEPWGIKDEAVLKEVLTFEVNEIRAVAKMIEPFMPETAKKIQSAFGKSKIEFGEHLFSRI